MVPSTSLEAQAQRIFRGLSESYEAVVDYATLMQDRKWKRWAVESAGLRRGMRVLDLGCGTCLLERRLRRDCHVVGIDLNREMLAVGQRNHGGALGSLLRSTGQALPFRGESFDVVVSCYVVKYCDEDRLISEAARVLRPSGRLVLYDFVRPRGSLWPLNAMYVYTGLRIIGKILELGHAESAYTFSELPGIIAKGSWEVGFGPRLECNGFTSVEETLLPGGVAIGFRAEKSRK